MTNSRCCRLHHCFNAMHMIVIFSFITKCPFSNLHVPALDAQCVCRLLHVTFTPTQAKLTSLVLGSAISKIASRPGHVLTSSLKLASCSIRSFSIASRRYSSKSALTSSICLSIETSL